MSFYQGTVTPGPYQAAAPVVSGIAYPASPAVQPGPYSLPASAPQLAHPQSVQQNAFAPTTAAQPAPTPSALSFQSEKSDDDEPSDTHLVQTSTKTKSGACCMSVTWTWRVIYGLLALSLLLILAAILVSVFGDPFTSTSTTGLDTPGGFTLNTNVECKRDPVTYSTSPQCTSQKPFWEEEVKRSGGMASNGDCDVDPSTGIMNCKAEEMCGGSKGQSNSVFIYPCGTKCGTAPGLLQECCDTCHSHGSITLQGDHYGVLCEGCDEVTKKVLPNCSFEEGAFKCHAEAQCQLGHLTSSSCNILPCDKCSTGELRATCCQRCLEMKCGDFQKSPVVCQGCHVESMTIAVHHGHLRNLLILLALIAAILALIVYCCMTRGYKGQTRSRSAALEPRAEAEPLVSAPTRWRSKLVGPNGEVLEQTDWHGGAPPAADRTVRLQEPLQMPPSTFSHSAYR